MQQRSGSLALGLLLDDLVALRRQILEASRAIRTLSRSDHYRSHVEHLLTIEGIGLITARHARISLHRLSPTLDN